MARSLIAVVLFSLAATALCGRQQEARLPSALGEFEVPKWYHGHDGPIFEIVQSIGDDVQLRRYERTTWVNTNVTGSTFDQAYKEGTRRLDDYWEGGNTPTDPSQGDKGTKVDETVPTVVLLYPAGSGETVQATYTVEYFLPHELHTAPPQPKAPELGLLSVNPQDVWVQTFGGYVHEREVLAQAFQFIGFLKQQGINVDESVVGVAFYDPVAQLVNRHNEIWVWGKPAPSFSIMEAGKRLSAWAKGVLGWRKP